MIKLKIWSVSKKSMMRTISTQKRKNTDMTARL